MQEHGFKVVPLRDTFSASHRSISILPRTKTFLLRAGYFHEYFSFFLSSSPCLSLSIAWNDVEIWCIFIVHDFKPTRLTRVTRAYHKTRECTESDEQPRSEFMRAKNIFGGNRSFVIWDEELPTFFHARSIRRNIHPYFKFF